MTQAMQSTQNTRLGIWLMIASALVFAVQDGVSRHLGANYSVYMFVMVRFWFFAAFVMVLAARSPGGLQAAVRTQYPLLQILRGLILVTEVALMVVGFVHLGLIESHAVFTCYPLLVAALSGPLLGEKVGWRRWTAIGIGFVGVLIILRPGYTVFSPWALVPLLAALLFAVYGLLTRYVSRKDSAQVSFFWTGIVGAVAMTGPGLWHWEPMRGADWGWLGLLCCMACLAHFMLIKAYSVAEASEVQPFAYLQLVFVAGIGIMVFNETMTWNEGLGAAIVVAAGLFTLWRQKVRARAAQLAA